MLVFFVKREQLGVVLFLCHHGLLLVYFDQFWRSHRWHDLYVRLLDAQSVRRRPDGLHLLTLRPLVDLRKVRIACNVTALFALHAIWPLHGLRALPLDLRDPLRGTNKHI